MNGNKILISVDVRHFCPKVEGQPTGLNVCMKGRDVESAIKAWNTRAEKAPDYSDAIKKIEGLKLILASTKREQGHNSALDKAIAILKEGRGDDR